MDIMLCSGNRAVMKRWNDLLTGQHQVEQVTSLGELRNRCTKKKFDLSLIHRLLVDVDAFSGLRKFAPLCKFFLLSDQPDEEEGIAFLKLGILGYANTYISQGRLAEAIHVITSGGVWLGQKVIQKLILESAAVAKEQAAPDAARRMAGLTRRERKVAEYVSRGRTNLEIAADLKITERTVKAHLTSVYEKTHISNRLGLALLINRG